MQLIADLKQSIQSDSSASNNIAHHKQNADAHISSYNLWNSKASFAEGNHLSSLFGAAYSDALSGLNSTLNIMSDLDLLESAAFHIQNSISPISMVQSAMAKDAMNQAQGNTSSQMAKINDYNNSQTDVKPDGNYSDLMTAAQAKIDEVKEIRSSLFNLFNENFLLFKGLQSYAESNIVLSARDVDSRNKGTFSARSSVSTINKSFEKSDNKEDKKDHKKANDNKPANAGYAQRQSPNNNTGFASSGFSSAGSQVGAMKSFMA